MISSKVEIGLVMTGLSLDLTDVLVWIPAMWFLIRGPVIQQFVWQMHNSNFRSHLKEPL